MTGGPHDTLRDELAEAIFPVVHPQAAKALATGEGVAEWDRTHELAADAVLSVVRRYADAQVAAERERIADELKALPFTGQVTYDSAIAKAISIARGQP